MTHSEHIDERHYDVVIVGAGVCGAVLSKVLSEQGKSVLILEAGTKQALTFSGYLENLDTFYQATAKTPESPYPFNPNAPQPDVLDAQPIAANHPSTKGYFVQKGPLPFLSTYPRTGGGTTLHWLGTCLRMLPEDFKLRTHHGQGIDWPISYEDLLPYYNKAEGEIGVSANVEEQQYLGIHFDAGYTYPMFKIPPSYLDQTLAAGIDGLTINFAGKSYPIYVTSTPQGRNGMPNPAYNKGQGYTPVGAVGNPDLGQRCQGNTSCVPICPIQAKYNALKTLQKAKRELVHVESQAVASKIRIDPASGRVTGIEYKSYHHPQSPEHTTHVAHGTIFVLAAHAVENAKLLLASGITSTSGMVGKHLMDHPVMLAWGLMPQRVGSFRGPLSTSGIESLRGGTFRTERAAFRIEIGNEGWNWAANAPSATVTNLVDKNNLFGRQLRRQINHDMPRQFRLGFLIEQLPEADNRVTIDPAYTDQLGNYRPIIQYNVSSYSRAGMAVAKHTADLIFQRLGVTDFTNYNDPTNAGYLEYEHQPYIYNGAGHFAGTHIMGASKYSSVVNPRQQSWDHANLYLAGCGNFPTVATSNPTLTMTALAFWAAENILADLNQIPGLASTMTPPLSGT